jgi:hypothetical protein
MYASLSNDIQLQGNDGAGLIARCRKDVKHQLHKCESGRIARIADKVHKATKKGLWQELRDINGVAVSRASNAVKAVVSKDGGSMLTEPVGVLKRLKEHYADLVAEEHQDAHRSSAMTAERIKEIRKGMEWAEISQCAQCGASTLVGARRLNADMRADDVKGLFRSLNWWKSSGDDNVRSHSKSIPSKTR